MAPDLECKGCGCPNKELLRLAEAFYRETPAFSRCSCEVRGVRPLDGDHCVFVHAPDKRCPQVLLIPGNKRAEAREIIPYFPVRERPNRQIVSYVLGKDLCNLAEVREMFGSLFSRYCGSYRLDELPQWNRGLSKITLWVHDCLTEDFDHQISLNRQDLHEGVCISYDFGMAFSNHYYPPFYTMELGIPDESILENRSFLLDFLTRYAGWVGVDEEDFIGRLEALYPHTCHRDRCRYILRNYKAFFPTRLYFGRFFEKLRNTPFEKDRLHGIAETIGMELGEVSGWESWIEKLRACPRGKLDLRGLDLSDMDLRRADLRGADLTDASLAGADLEGADMRGAKVNRVDLRGANLSGAKRDRDR
jgi:Pentapeptide repeats (8 copies)